MEDSTKKIEKLSEPTKKRSKYTYDPNDFEGAELTHEEGLALEQWDAAHPEIVKDSEEDKS